MAARPKARTSGRSFAAAPGTVRITGGAIKGRKLAVPEGAGVRPTTDRARETLFNVLTNRFRRPGGESVLIGARVLDAFAGTGAMGLEAWSRGAEYVAFVEADTRHFSTLSGNLRAAKLPPAAGSAQRDCSPLVSDGGRFDIVIADPPYEQGAALVNALMAQRALWHGETLLVWEHPRDTASGMEDCLKGWEAVHQTPSGKTVFSFFRPTG